MENQMRRAVTFRSIGFVILLTMLLGGCKASGVDENGTANVFRDPGAAEVGATAGTAAAATAAATPGTCSQTSDSQEVWHFYDESVQKEAEDILGKTGNRLTKDDFDTLSGLKDLMVKEPIKTLKDIPVLFPDLRYLSISCVGCLSQEDCDCLKRLSSLQALTLSSGPVADQGIADNLLYFEYTLDTADSSKQNDPSSFSVLGRDFIDGKCKGNPIKIMRILDDGTIYELVVTDAAEPGELAASQEKKVFVSDRKGESVECTAVLDGTDRIGDQPLNRIYVLDANFDGKKDILLDQGHSGSQESATYQCFISDGNTFVSCPSFSDIENPVIDHPDKMVLSSWRNWAASHSWAKYHFDGGRFVMTDCLTEEETGSDSHGAVWRYTIEKRLHNKMQEVERFSTKDRSDKELDAMIFDKDSGWGLLSDKWKSNDLDLGMAGDGSLDSRLWDIIHQ